MTHLLKTDGGARGNPGPAAAAFVLFDGEGETVSRGGRYLGVATNNVAEYEALIWGLETARALGVGRLEVHMDSELVVKQINGEYKVKHDGLKRLHLRARALLGDFQSVRVVHVRREQNKEADALCNEAMDLQATVGDAPEPGQAGVQGSLFE